MSNESGRMEVYVCRFNEDGWTSPGMPISTNGGFSPLWSPDGKTLYNWVTSSREMWAVSVSTEPESSASQPKTLFDNDKLRAVSGLDPLPDGRFLMLQKGEDEGEIKHINVVLNWVEELKRRVPTDP